LSKRYSHDEMLLIPQIGMSSSPCGLLDNSLCGTSDSLPSHRHWRIPKDQKTNTLNSKCCLRSDFYVKYLPCSAHTQRLLKLQSILRRAPSYRTLELQLIEWQERELFEYFVVVSLKKKPGKNSYTPEVTYQFPKVKACALSKTCSWSFEANYTWHNKLDLLILCHLQCQLLSVR
ncbi:hypothetical protein XENOCAPTIV_024852, partial [Xenoophorus captivus]